MDTLPTPYTPDEITALRGRLPERGVYCANCRLFIPVFDLGAQQERQLRELHQTNPILAVRRLRDVTGCDPKWAKIWLSHPDGPHAEGHYWTGPPCPHCGQKLRRPQSEQCFHCGTDWHDPDRLLRHGKPVAK